MMRPGLCIAMLLLCGCRPQQAQVDANSGHDIYMARCALCHGDHGQGIAPYPPLARSQWVDGPPERFAAIILDGAQGPLGNSTGVMPGWRTILPDAEIAAVMTRLRQADGKPPVTPIQVHEVRIQTDPRGAPWTQTDLQNLHMR